MSQHSCAHFHNDQLSRGHDFLTHEIRHIEKGALREQEAVNVCRHPTVADAKDASGTLRVRCLGVGQFFDHFDDGIRRDGISFRAA